MSRGHQVGRELNALEADVENPGQRADHQRLGQPRHALQQAMAAGEDRGEDLLDHLVLPDDDLLQLLLHELPMLGELLQNIAQAPLFDGGPTRSGCGIGSHQGGSARLRGSGFSIQSRFAPPL